MKGTLMNLRDQLKRLNLRSDAEVDKKYHTTGNFSLINHMKSNSVTKPGVFGFKLNLSEMGPKKSKLDKNTIKSSTRYNKFFNARKAKMQMDPDSQFHSNMIMYKNSLPPFFKSSKYVLINQDGELLQEETEALRAHLSPHPENFEETEVPFSQNEEESVAGGRTENERLIQLIPKKFKENLVYKYKDKNT